MISRRFLPASPAWTLTSEHFQPHRGDLLPATGSVSPTHFKETDMADYLSQGAFQPSLPQHLLTDEDRQLIEAFGISIEPDGEDKLVLFADDCAPVGSSLLTIPRMTSN